MVDNITWAESGAWKHYNRFGRRYEIDDLKSAAHLGLMRAARKFDFRPGIKFRSYAFRSIEQCLRMVHRQHLRQTGWRYDDGEKKGRMERLVQFTAWPTNEEGEQLDVAAPEPSETIEERIHREQLTDTLRERVLRVAKNERERQVLKGRLSGQTLQETADQIGVSRRRVQQIEAPMMERIARRFGGHVVGRDNGSGE